MNFWRGLATGTLLGVAAVMLLTDEKKRKEIMTWTQKPVTGMDGGRVLRGVRRTVRDLVKD